MMTSIEIRRLCRVKYGMLKSHHGFSLVIRPQSIRMYACPKARTDDLMGAWWPTASPGRRGPFELAAAAALSSPQRGGAMKCINGRRRGQFERWHQSRIRDNRLQVQRREGSCCPALDDDGGRVGVGGALL